MINKIKNLLAPLRLCERLNSLTRSITENRAGAKSFCQGIGYLTEFRGFDHSASKIHGQGAINHKKLLKLYNKMPIRNPVTSRMHVHLFCRALNENWGRYREK
jgi:hypothetical protein